MQSKEDAITIVDKLADHFKINKKHAATMYQILVESFYELMEKNGGKVYIEHLGQFKVIKKNNIPTIQFNPARVLTHIAKDLASKGMVHTRHRKIEEEKV